MKNTLLLIGVFCVSLMNAQVRETESGLRHEFLVNEPGMPAKVGDLVTLHMLIESNSGQEIRNSWKQGKPILFPSRVSSFQSDIYESVRLMSEGDSARFWVNADSMYLKVFKKEKPKEIKSGSDLLLTIKSIKVRSQKEYKEEQAEFYNENLKEDQKLVDERKKQEEIKIQKFISESGFQFKKTKSGAYYAITGEGKGEQYPVKGKAVVFSYVGMLIDGTQFESTDEDVGHAVTFTIGDNSVIQGWEDVFPNIPIGGKAQMIIPSHLGYGNIAKGDRLPANSILVFDVQLVAIY